jgi:Formate/nitrite transporter
MGYGGVFSDEAYKTELFNFATKKAIVPEWHQIFLRGIVANWLVCLAVFLSISAREIISKIFAIWWPTFFFVALGTDHVVANMIFIPLAIFYGCPNLSVSYYIWKSMIPTALGNIVGGGLFVGAVYWYLYLTGPGSDEVSDSFSTSIGGPTGRDKSHVSGVTNGDVIHGQDPTPMDTSHHGSIPNGSFGHSTFSSGIGKDLGTAPNGVEKTNGGPEP